MAPRMKRRVAVGLAAGLLALTGCGPKGQPCKRPEDIKIDNGRAYTCTYHRDGNTWQ